MAPAEESECRIVECLHAEREPVHPRRGVAGEAAGFDGAGIGLERDLEIGSGGPQGFHARDDRGDTLGRHERGRAAAEEETGDDARTRLRCVMLELGCECRTKAPLLEVLAHVAVEVAIGAFREAEGPMDVDAETRRVARGSPCPARLRHALRDRTHGAKQAAISLRKASARWLIASLAAGSISP